MMNCKEGDLAIMVKSDAGNEGKIFTCIRYVGAIDGWVHDDYWEIDRHINSSNLGPQPYASDSYMRPIRPSNEQDEMLKIAGLPKVVA